MKKVSVFLSDDFHFLVIKFSVYLKWCVFVMSLLRLKKDQQRTS